MKEQASALNGQMSGRTAEEIIAFFLREYKGRVALASSLGIEDQALTDIMVKADRAARIFTIDTGRLFPETYSLIDRTNKAYGIRMEVFFPQHEGVEDFVGRQGVNAFYASVELRRECCHVRKLEPLHRALSGLDVWICGLRREQSVTRTGVEVVEWDEAHGLLKVNPLVEWSEADVWRYIRLHSVPYNALHDRHFPSIGCQPCTRAVNEGADIRSGRWWWENPEHKECGLHAK